MYYTVYSGREKGIYNNWKDCEKNVKGFPNAIFKKFKNREEAEYFLLHGIIKENKHNTTGKKNNVNNCHLIPGGINVFTDGSRILKNNTFYGGYGIYFGENDHRNISTPYNDGEITNNRAELFAILEALNILKNEIEKGEKINIFTDSEYSFKSVTIWYKKWEQNGWKDNNGNIRKNLDYIKPISNILNNHTNISIKHIYSHTGKKDYYSLGNEEADKLAVTGAKESILNLT